MIMNFALLSFDKPVANSEIVISHIFTQVEGFKDFLGIKVLLVTCDVHDHRALATVTYQDSKKLFPDFLLRILIKPLCLSAQIAKLTRIYFCILLERSFKTYIRLDKYSGSLNCIESHLIWHSLVFDKVADYQSCTPADTCSTDYED